MILILAAAMLSGCGDSTPEPEDGSAGQEIGASQASLASAMSKAPDQGTFAPIAANEITESAYTDSACNLDSVAGGAVANASLQRASSPMFAGWIADSATGSVPASMRIVLRGEQDFAVAASTGFQRADVAKARNQPSLRDSGYMVKADLAQVSAGEYSVVLLHSTSGHIVVCDTHKRIVVR